MADPRDGVGPEGVPAPPPAGKPLKKRAKREMASSVVPVADEQSSRDADTPQRDA